MEVQNAVGTDHLKRRIGAHLPPSGQAWDEPAARKGVCRRHAKRLRIPVALHGGESCDKCFEAVADDWKEAGGGARRGEGGWGAARKRPAGQDVAPPALF